MFFEYILTSGHEGTHSIPAEQMGALITRSVTPNLAGLVRGQISANHTEPETLVSFVPRRSLGASGRAASHSACNPSAYLTVR